MNYYYTYKSLEPNIDAHELYICVNKLYKKVQMDYCTHDGNEHDEGPY